MSSLTKLLIDNHLILILTLITLILVYIQTSLSYWKWKNINYVKLPKFNLSESMLYRAEDYRYFKKIGAKFFGVFVYLSPVLVLIDPNVIKQAFIRDFHIFNNRGTIYDPEKDPLSHHLLFMKGKDWKNMRVKLTPAFTSGKMKLMFDYILSCSNILVDAIGTNLNDIHIKERLSCFGIDVIGSCAFGLEINSLNEKTSQFHYYGKQVFDDITSSMKKRVFINTNPRLASFLGLHMLNTEIWNFFYGFVKKSMQFREENNYRRNDFLQILIDMRNSTNEEEHLTIEEITAQCYLFFLAGFETTSSTLVFALHELAENKDIQDKTREEINKVLSKYDGKITYDSLKEMKYLEQVFDETLRKFPVSHTLRRVCETDYIIPETNATIHKGTNVLIPLLSLHRDEEYYPDPEKFDPERFNDVNKSLLPPNVYLPFGIGPRICIGIRFAIMQSRTVLINLLRNYEFTISKKTTPIVFNPYSFTINPINPIYLNAKKIS